MALQFRRGLDSQRTTITPQPGEPIWSTDTTKLYIGDGITPGGVEISLISTTATTATIGGVKIGDGISITADGTISVSSNAVSDQPLYTTSSVTFNSVTATETVAIINGFLGLRTTLYQGVDHIGIATNDPKEIFQFSASNNKSVKFLAQITDGGDIHLVELSIITDGTDSWKVEYGINTNNGILGTFSTVNSGTQCLVYFTPIAATNMNIRLASILLST